jgi:phosphatidate cytidylyltransferase
MSHLDSQDDAEVSAPGVQPAEPPPPPEAPLGVQPPAVPAPGANSNRAGRNLPAAFAVGGGLAAVALATLLVWRPAFLAVVLVAVAVGVWELVRAVRPTGARPPLPALLAGGAAMPVVAWFWGLDALGLGLLVTALAVMVWRLGGGPVGYLRDISAAVLIAVYVPFLAGFVALLSADDDGHWRVLVMLAVVVLSDTGGYVAGVLFGRRQLAPMISPKKSWEGLAGSLVAAAAGGAVGLAWRFEVDWWWGAVFGLVVAGAAVLGDLAESLLKRDLGVKDMSGLLPGHGGMLDRVDSILFAAPVAYVLLTVLSGSGWAGSGPG